MKDPRSWIARAALALTLVSLAGCDSFIRSQIYLSDNHPTEAEAIGPDHAAVQTVRTADGHTLHGLFVAPSKPGFPVVLFFHGNAGCAESFAYLFGPLVTHGYGVLIADYRGYGDSDGSPTEDGLYADGMAFAKRAEQLNDGKPAVIVGNSLGSAVALEVAKRGLAADVVTFGAFTSIDDVAPAFARPLMPDHFRNIDKVAAIKVPWVIVHAKNDPLIPYAHGRTLADKARQAGLRVAFLTLQGDAHRPEADFLPKVIDASLAFAHTGGTDAFSGLAPHGEVTPQAP